MTSNGADEPDYNAIKAYLSSDCYPEKMKGRPDLKSNLRKVSSNIELNSILHFQYAEVKMKMKSGAPPYLRLVKDVEARNKVLMLLIKRFKSWWMPLCGKININARQFVKTCAQC